MHYPARNMPYLELLGDLVQGEALKSPEANKLIDPVQYCALVVLIAPNVIWDDFGYNSSTKCGHMRSRTCQVCE